MEKLRCWPKVLRDEGWWWWWGLVRVGERRGRSDKAFGSRNLKIDNAACFHFLDA